MAIGQGGYTGDRDAITASLAGNFVDDFRELDQLSGMRGKGYFTEKEENILSAALSERAWEQFKKDAKSAGKVVLNWLGETAFEGSQNPAGLGQRALAAASYPFKTAAEVSFDYINPYSPGGYMHSEQMPEWLGFLNENEYIRSELARQPALAAAPALLGGFGIPINRWASGEDVNKGELVGGIASLAGPTLPLIGRVAGHASHKVAPQATDQARRSLLKAAGVGTGLLAAPIAATKLVGGKVGTAAKAALKIGTLTSALTGGVMANLKGVLNRTRVGLQRGHWGQEDHRAMEAMRRGETLRSPSVEHDIGVIPGKNLSDELDKAENQQVISFFDRVLKEDQRLGVLNFIEATGRGKTDLPTLEAIQRSPEVGIGQVYEFQKGRLSVVDTSDHLSVGNRSDRGLDRLDADGMPLRSLDDQVDAVIRENLDAISNVTNKLDYEGGYVPHNPDPGGTELSGRAHELVNIKSSFGDDISNQMDFVTYHANKVDNVAHAYIRLDEGSALIDDLAENSPEHLRAVLTSVINDAEKSLDAARVGLREGQSLDDLTHINLATERGTVIIDVPKEQFVIKTAKELLEALDPPKSGLSKRAEMAAKVKAKKQKEGKSTLEKILDPLGYGDIKW